MLVLPSLAAARGPRFLLRLVGVLGLAWLAVWRLTLRRWGQGRRRLGRLRCPCRHLNLRLLRRCSPRLWQLAVTLDSACLCGT